MPLPTEYLVGLWWTREGKPTPMDPSRRPLVVSVRKFSSRRRLKEAALVLLVVHRAALCLVPTYECQQHRIGQARPAQQQVQRRRRSAAPQVRLPGWQAHGAAAGVRVPREGVQEPATGRPGWSQRP